MKVRSIDANNDWEKGKGKSNYKTGVLACAQNIKTNLQSFLGDCFFQTDAGIDWFNHLGGKNQLQLKVDVSATILKTPDVILIEELNIRLDNQRKLSIQYSANTTYGRISNQTLTPEV